MQKLKFLILFIFSIYSFTTVKEVRASEFSNSIHSTYTVNRDGTTLVEHHLKIKNNTPTTYLKQYALKTSYSGLSNIVVTNKQKQVIDSNITNDGSGTLIAITFADQVVVMNEGIVVQVGSPKELFEKPAHTFVGYFLFILLSNDSTLKR